MILELNALDERGVDVQQNTFYKAADIKTIPVQPNIICRDWNDSRKGFEADQDPVKEGDSLDPAPERFLDRNESWSTERGLTVDLKLLMYLIPITKLFKRHR